MIYLADKFLVSSESLEAGLVKLNPDERISILEVHNLKDPKTKGLMMHYYTEGKIQIVDADGKAIESKIEVPEEIHTEVLQENEDGDLIEVIEVQKVVRTYDVVLHELSNIL
jgi:hypothetical protein